QLPFGNGISFTWSRGTTVTPPFDPFMVYRTFVSSLSTVSGPRPPDPGLWTLDSELWTLDSELWTLDSGLRTPDSGLKALQRPLPILDDIHPCVLDHQRRVQAVAVQMELAHVLAAGIGVVVVTEREMHRAQQPFLR